MNTHKTVVTKMEKKMYVDTILLSRENRAKHTSKLWDLQHAFNDGRVHLSPICSPAPLSVQHLFHLKVQVRPSRDYNVRKEGANKLYPAAPLPPPTRYPLPPRTLHSVRCFSGVCDTIVTAQHSKYPKHPSSSRQRYPPQRYRWPPPVYTRYMLLLSS